MELSERFKSNEYEVLSAVEKLLLDTFTETTVDTDALETVCTVYGEDFDYARLKAQLELFSHEDKDEIQQRIDSVSKRARRRRMTQILERILRNQVSCHLE